MKSLFPIILMVVFAITACRKENIIDSSFDYNAKIIDLPFEDSNLKMEIISKTIPGGSSLPLRAQDMHFFNETTGIIITYSGEIYKTSDTGLNWSLQYSNPTNKLPLIQILFINPDTGYVVGGDNSSPPPYHPSGGIILKTTDGGDSWTPVFQDSGLIECSTIAVNENGNLFVIGSSNHLVKKDKIFRSIDGGNNWDTLDWSNKRIVNLTFIKNFGFCTAGFQPGTIYRSSDDGDNWSIKSTFINTNWTTDIEFRDSIGFCLTDNTSIYKTNDFGENWSKVHSGDSYKIDLLTPNSCLIWGLGGWYGGDFGYSLGAVRQTINGGKDWIDYNFKKEIKEIRCSSFFSTTEGYVISGVYLIKVTVK